NRPGYSRQSVRRNEAGNHHRLVCQAPHDQAPGPTPRRPPDVSTTRQELLRGRRDRKIPAAFPLFPLTHTTQDTTMHRLLPDIRSDIATIDIDDAFAEIVGDVDETPVSVRAPQARCADGHGTLS